MFNIKTKTVISVYQLLLMPVSSLQSDPCLMQVAACDWSGLCGDVGIPTAFGYLYRN